MSLILGETVDAAELNVFVDHLVTRLRFQVTQYNNIIIIIIHLEFRSMVGTSVVFTPHDGGNLLSVYLHNSNI